MKDFGLSDLVQSFQQSSDVSIVIAYQSMILPTAEEEDRWYLHEIVTMNQRPYRERIIASTATRSSHQLEFVLEIGFRYDLRISGFRDQGQLLLEPFKGFQPIGFDLENIRLVIAPEAYPSARKLVAQLVMNIVVTVCRL